jgi:hypothetical protein
MGGKSSKAIFSDIVKKVLSEDVPHTEHEFWDLLWKTVLPVEDIFELVSADEVRQLISEHPENMKIMVTQAVAQLYQVVETPYAIYFDQALNCSRILARLLPFLLESKSKVIKELLWSRKFTGTNSKETIPKSGQSHRSEGEEEGEEEGHQHPHSDGESEPLAVILINTIFHLLFLPDFTIEDPGTEFTESDINTPDFKAALMWAPGVGCAEKTVVYSSQFDNNRIDVLRVMIAAFSDALYQSADAYDSCASLWLEVATATDAPYAEILFYSLMNTVLGKLPTACMYSVIFGLYYPSDCWPFLGTFVCIALSHHIVPHHTR